MPEKIIECLRKNNLDSNRIKQQDLNSFLELFSDL